MALKQNSRLILTLFGILDAILFGRFLDKVASTRPPILGQLPIGDSALALIEWALLLSFIFSAVGLALERKWALVLTFVQFPFRFIFVTWSFGFLGALPWLGSMGAQVLLYAYVILEIVRLIVSIQLHRGR